MLYRGKHKLPHQSQVLWRDLTAEDLTRRFLGKTSYAYMLTDEQLQDRIDGKPGTSLPYRFLIYSPDCAATSWTAFYTRADLQHWLDAYGLSLDHEPKAGEQFRVSVPEKLEMQELVDG